MKDKVKFIACDIDKTIPVDRDKITKDALNTFNSAMNKGVFFALASGRYYKDMKGLSDNLDCFYICSDGAVCIKNNEILFSYSIPLEIISKILEKTTNSVLLYGLNEVWCCSEDESFVSKCKERYSVLRVINKADEINKEVYKIAIYKADDFSGVIRYIKSNRLLNRVYNTNEWKEFVNINTSKGVAVKRLFEMLGIKAQNACAFGDSENDIDMLRAVRHSFAVADGIDKLKKVCKRISYDVLKDIERIINEEENL